MCSLVALVVAPIICHFEWRIASIFVESNIMFLFVYLTERRNKK